MTIEDVMVIVPNIRHAAQVTKRGDFLLASESDTIVGLSASVAVFSVEIIEECLEIDLFRCTIFDSRRKVINRP